MARRLGAGENDAGDGRCAVRVFLKFRVPKIFWWMTMLAGEEAEVGAHRVGGKGEREGKAHRSAVRPPALALKIVKLEIADALGAKIGGIGCAVPLEHEHGQTFMRFQKIAIKGAEREVFGAVRSDAAVVGDAQQL